MLSFIIILLYSHVDTFVDTYSVYMYTLHTYYIYIQLRTQYVTLNVYNIYIYSNIYLISNLNITEEN